MKNPIVKQLLREALMSKEDEKIKEVADFVNFAKEFLGIDDDIKLNVNHTKHHFQCNFSSKKT